MVVARTIESHGVAVGYVASFVRGETREVTHWIDRAHWRKGIATAALRAFLRTEETRRPLAGRVAFDNVASRRVLEKCGFVLIGKERGFANARREEIEELILHLKRE